MSLIKLMYNSETQKPITGKYDPRFGFLIPLGMERDDEIQCAVIPKEEIVKMLNDIKMESDNDQM